jgi:hypothetical protein
MNIIKSVGIGTAMVGVLYMLLLLVKLFTMLSQNGQYVVGTLGLIALFSTCTYMCIHLDEDVADYDGELDDNGDYYEEQE